MHHTCHSIIGECLEEGVSIDKLHLSYHHHTRDYFTLQSMSHGVLIGIPDVSCDPMMLVGVSSNYTASVFFPKQSLRKI